MAYPKRKSAVKKERIVFLVGPTATGKSEIAVSLARRLKAEIISCDSMQVYKKMDILTAKPRAALQKIIPHHLISTLSPEKEYNVSLYRKSAVSKAKDILKRGGIPVFAGGSGLYMSILLDGIFDIGHKDQGARARLYKQADRKGSVYLHERLRKVDPEAAEKIHPHDAKRIIRALEVFISTGKPISYLQKKRYGLWGEYDILIFGLNMKRDGLYERIDERVDKMFALGLADEVRRLLKGKLSRTAASAIGVKELKGYFDGLYDLEEAKRLIKRNSRRYAKAQLTWFRKDKRIRWIKVKEREKPGEVAKKIWKELY